LRGDVGLYSFGPGKPLFTVRGGVAVTNRADLHEKLHRYREAHMQRMPIKESIKRRVRLAVSCLSQSDAGYALALRLGLERNSFERSATEIPDSYATPYADFQARMGLSLLRKLDAIEARRREMVMFYDRELRDIPGIFRAPIVEGATYSYYTARVPQRDAIEFSQRLYRRGIQSGRTFDYAAPDFAQYRAYRRHPVPRAEQAGREAVNLPIHANLSRARAQFIVDQVRRVLQADPQKVSLQKV
jgi:dTDP-4-amino-4,6-dideoxygalactose transaminase